MQQIISMSTAALPSDFSLRRDPPPRCKVLKNSFWQHYDSTTLLYDAVQSADGTVTLFAPKLFNLREVLEAALEPLSQDIQGRVHWRFGRHLDCVRFRLDGSRQSLPLVLGGATLEVPLTPLDTETFRGSNVVYTLSKNNDLGWVRDWLHYHHAAHGANGAVIADNGSTAYSTKELLETMRAVPGYRSVAVLRAPLPFGPRLGECTSVSKAEFLQASLLNLARDRLLSTSRAMLNIDIDEMVVGRGDRSIFDATANSLFGFITFTGQWRYPCGAKDGVRHSDHLCRSSEPVVCPTKYCIRPDSFVGKRHLQVHSVANADRNLFRSRRNFSYLHLRHISTSWKYDRARDTPQALVHDSATEALFKKYLPTRSE